MSFASEKIDPPPTTLRSFFAGIIDYAGLFPPARLPLETAIKNFVQYLDGNDAWMLSRFVIPVDKLSQLSDFSALLESKPPVRFSVLGTGGSSDLTFVEHLEEDITAMNDVELRHPGRLSCEAMEIRFPTSITASDVASLTVRGAAALLEERNRADAELYLEVPWQEEFDDLLQRVAYAVAEANASHTPLVGLKIRSGGLERSLFPSAERLARFIATCDEAGIPFKATAGLHHPFPRLDETVDGEMHGFVNVFGGAALLHAERVATDELVTILSDADPASFTLNSDGFAWKDRHLTRDDVEAGRRFARSFGSCSFDEPRDDLRQLNLL